MNNYASTPSVALLTGLPIVKSEYVKRGTAIILTHPEMGSPRVILGLWWDRPTVGSIIASQRRRRHRT